MHALVLEFCPLDKALSSCDPFFLFHESAHDCLDGSFSGLGCCPRSCVTKLFLLSFALSPSGGFEGVLQCVESEHGKPRAFRLSLGARDDVRVFVVIIRPAGGTRAEAAFPCCSDPQVCEGLVHYCPPTGFPRAWGSVSGVGGPLSKLLCSEIRGPRA